jgi:hypothetical protein
MKSHALAAEGLALIAILVLGAGLRLARLDHNPPGVFRDEAEKGLNAWALGRGGSVFDFVPDAAGRPTVEWRRWPLFINVYGVRTSALYQYALAPLARGEAPPSPAVLRLPAALAGLASVAAVYLAARLLYGAGVGLGAAFWLAVSPWSVAFSRWALQGAFVPLFMALGAGGLALGLRRRPAWLVLGGAALGAAFYGYSGARPFVLAFVVAAVLLERKALWEPRRRKWACAAAGLFALFVVPALVAMAMPGGMGRLARISVFGEGRGLFQALWAMAGNYFIHFSPGFLFLRGDPELRHGVASFGQIYHVEFLFALAGAWALWRGGGRERRLWAAWLALFPVGAMLTSPSQMPHALRTLVLLPLPQILAGHGLVWFAARLGRRRPVRESAGAGAAASRGRATLAWALVSLATAASVGGFAFDLFGSYPRYSARHWAAGFGEALASARERRGAEGVVCVSGSIALARYLTLYYDGVTPERLAAEGHEALGAYFPPPAFDLRPLWRSLPAGSTLVAVPEDARGLDAFPVKIVHPPSASAAESEELPATFWVYKKN